MTTQEPTKPSKAPSPKPGRTFKPEPLNPEEVRAVLAACSRKFPTGIRNRALLALLFTTGLRISEALALHPKDLDLDAGSVRVLNGKGGKSRLVGVPDETITIIERWLDVRTRRGLNGRQPLFCTVTVGGAGPHATAPGSTMKTAYVRTLLPRLARKAGLEKRVHAHGFRHSFAVELLKGGAALHEIQAALGHAAPSITDAYLRGLTNADAVDAVRRRPWDIDS